MPSRASPPPSMPRACPTARNARLRPRFWRKPGASPPEPELLSGCRNFVFAQMFQRIVLPSRIGDRPAELSAALSPFDCGGSSKRLLGARNNLNRLPRFAGLDPGQRGVHAHGKAPVRLNSRRPRARHSLSSVWRTWRGAFRRYRQEQGTY
ncbi:hypothetical protein MPL3365_140223 [Mesorhizobium plurifarium]|uniref:Uncharacterized protein n=1 Tax=Mesorhizobium plurifarium TaxID=69974 RepID=A0A090FXY2_MESPL|nr:hypothetical protein MPL3365_140223 [Mesorhizobium plurifarium]